MVAIHEELEHRYKAVFQYNNYMYTLYLLYSIWLLLIMQLSYKLSYIRTYSGGLYTVVYCYIALV